MALTASSQASRLFKKSFGYGETAVQYEWFEEPYSGSEIVLSNQIWSESDLIPSVAPILASGASSGVVQYFEKMPMIPVGGLYSSGKSFYLPELKNSLSYTVQNGAYSPQLFTNADVSIPFGQGNWLIDHSAGLVTFYPGVSGGELMPTGVDFSNPPKITFYKYVGDFGFSSGGGSGTVYAGTGLTSTGSTLSVNFQSITGVGLTQNGNQISLDSSSIASSLAGDGLSANGGTLSVNVGNGLSLESDSVILGGTLSQNTTVNSNGYDFGIENFDILILTGSVVDIQLDNGLFLLDSGESGSIELYSGDFTIYATGSVDITSTDEFTLETGTGSITTNNSQGLVYASDYSSTFVGNSLITKTYVDNGTSSIWNAISSINGDFITGVTAGSGLSGGGTSGYITLDVNVSNGLIINGNNVEIDPLVAGSGLTFSSGSIDLVWGGTATGLTVSVDAVAVVVDGTTIKINGSGELTAVSGVSTPVYDRVNSFVTSGNDQSTGMFLSQTPNDYSRIQVYVNGQLQRLGNGITTNVDCYISSTPSISENLANISSGQQLYWNGSFANFDLSTTDIIEIIYES
jgi:hypothetical protein